MFRYAINIAILLCTTPLAFSETYYDCNRADRTITYRAEPCHANEWEIQRQEVNLTQYDEGKKEHTGASQSPINIAISENGGFYIAGTINGHAVNFQIDTGAGMLAISTQAAKDYGITGCENHGKSSTANGTTDTCITKAASLTFGNFELKDIDISVMPNMNDHPLLGMNVLRLFKVEAQNGSLRISK